MPLKLNCNLTRGAFSLRVDTEFADRRVSALFGPSGAGKTSVLRIIAGLDHTPGAQVSFNEEIWQDEHTFIPAHRRGIGYVFQQLNLFPHLSAADNLAYASHRRHKPEGLSQDEIIDMLDISDLLDKRPGQLSGGEQQRVAIARALLSHPKLLLMDEPLGAIDQFARNRILPYLQRVHHALDIPVIFISHSLEEVLYLADHVYQIEAGRVASASAAIEFAVSDAGATHNNAAAIVSCEVIDTEAAYALTRVSLDGQTLYISAEGFDPGELIRVKIPARDVSLTRTKATETSIINIIEGTVLDIQPASNGPVATVTLACGQQRLLARITRKSVNDLGLMAGDKVFAQIKGVALLTDYER